MHLTGNVEGVDGLQFVLFDDQEADTMVVFSVTGGAIDVILERIPDNEIFFLEIKGRADGFEDQIVEWREVLPVHIKDGGELQLIAEQIEEGGASLSNRKFRIEGGGEEQAFLEAWHQQVSDKQDELDAQTTFEGNLRGSGFRMQGRAAEEARQALAQINRDFINQGKPLVSTLYLISMENDHRSKVNEYSAVYDQASAEVQNSKYGIDLNNRIHRITQFNPKLDFEKLLASRTAQLQNFDASKFADHEYLVLTFWSTRFPQAIENLPEVEKMVPAERADKIAVIHFSLDTKMSSWKAVDDQLKLPHSFLLRAEVRQQAIDELYLTELPRYMVVKSDGSVVENDVPFEDLEAVIKGL